MIRFWDGWRPELPLEPLLPSRVGALVDVVEEVDTATRPLVVDTNVRVLLPLTVTTVVTSCSVLLLTDVETETVGLLEVMDLGSVDVIPPVDDSEVEDAEERDVVEAIRESEDEGDDGAVVVLPKLLLEAWFAVSDGEVLGGVVEADGGDEELEVRLELPEVEVVEVVEAPVLSATPFWRRWIAPSTLKAVVMESSIKEKIVKEWVSPDLSIFGWTKWKERSVEQRLFRTLNGREVPGQPLTSKIDEYLLWRRITLSLYLY